MSSEHQTPTRYVLQALLRALDELELEHHEQEQSGRITVVDFEVPDEERVAWVRALTLENELVTFYVQTELEIPEDRVEELTKLVIGMNANLPLGTFELDPEDHELRVRHSVDCIHIPEEALPAVFRHAIAIVTHLWSKSVPSVLEALGLEPDALNTLPGADADALEDTSDTGPNWRVGYLESRIEEVDPTDPLPLLEDTLHHTIVLSHSGEIADMLASTLTRLAGHYWKRMLQARRPRAEVRVVVMQSAGELPALVIQATGVPPLRFWFDAAKLETYLDDLAGEDTLYHAVRPEDVQRCLTDGFSDEVTELHGDFTLDEHGVPMDEGVRTRVEGVLVSDQPLPREDLGDCTAIVRMHWARLAPIIFEWELFEIAYTGSDARLLLPGTRRWCVPAEYMNPELRKAEVQVELQ